MGEATAEVSIRLISFREAVAFLTEACGSTSIAQRLLEKGLSEERVRWICQLLQGDLEGWDLPISKPAHSGKFWRQYPAVDPSGNTARIRKYLYGFTGSPWKTPAAPEVYMIRVADEDVRSLVPPSPAPTAVTERPGGPQADRVLRVLPELYPPEGIVPIGIPVKTVEGQVADVLAADSEKQKLTAPKWDVISDCVKYLRALHT